MIKLVNLKYGDHSASVRPERGQREGWRQESSRRGPAGRGEAWWEAGPGAPNGDSLQELETAGKQTAPGPLEGERPCQPLDSGPGKLVLDFWLPVGEKINVRWFSHRVRGESSQQNPESRALAHGLYGGFVQRAKATPSEAVRRIPQSVAARGRGQRGR